MLVGCKIDLRPPDSSHPGFVSPQQGDRLAEQIGAVGYRECSALKKVGVDSVFEDLVRAAVTAQRQEAKAKGCCVIA
jgi:Rho family, other